MGRWQIAVLEVSSVARVPHTADGSHGNPVLSLHLLHRKRLPCATPIAVSFPEYGTEQGHKIRQRGHWGETGTVGTICACAQYHFRCSSRGWWRKRWSLWRRSFAQILCAICKQRNKLWGLKKSEETSERIKGYGSTMWSVKINPVLLPFSTSKQQNGTILEQKNKFILWHDARKPE
jgi:hypothetical protein